MRPRVGPRSEQVHGIGSIEVGKLAVLVVLDKNLFEVAPHDIHETRVAMTVMNGRIRHE